MRRFLDWVKIDCEGVEYEQYERVKKNKTFVLSCVKLSVECVIEEVKQ